MISGMILRALVKLADDSTGALTAQVVDIDGDDADDELEVLEPVGVHFLPSLDEEMAVFEANGAADNRFVMGASQRGHRPQDLTDAGTGGLHLRGQWKVFLDSDGTTHIGKRDPSDFVALASLVKAELDAIKSTLDAMKTAHDGHIHVTTATVGTGGPVGVISPTVTTFPTPSTPGDVGSTTVKTE